mmetsp:Transcript_127492/g.369095  ORF Transcript_127492/g.369095 Transcript_127492/m.369095 type:complete len:304 (+) Transcript_127492:448-1359(+)
MDHIRVGGRVGHEPPPGAQTDDVPADLRRVRPREELPRLLDEGDILADSGEVELVVAAVLWAMAPHAREVRRPRIGLDRTLCDALPSARLSPTCEFGLRALVVPPIGEGRKLQAHGICVPHGPEHEGAGVRIVADHLLTRVGCDPVLALPIDPLPGRRIDHLDEIALVALTPLAVAAIAGAVQHVAVLGHGDGVRVVGRPLLQAHQRALDGLRPDDLEARHRDLHEDEGARPDARLAGHQDHKMPAARIELQSPHLFRSDDLALNDNVLVVEEKQDRVAVGIVVEKGVLPAIVWGRGIEAMAA